MNRSESVQHRFSDRTHVGWIKNYIKAPTSVQAASHFTSNPPPRQQVCDRKIVILNWGKIRQSCRKCMSPPIRSLRLKFCWLADKLTLLRERKSAFALHAWTKIPPPELSWQMRQIKSCNRRGKEVSRQISWRPFIHAASGHTIYTQYGK